MKTTSHKYTESESSVHFPPNVLTGKKSSLRFKNEEEKTKTFLKTIVLGTPGSPSASQICYAAPSRKSCQIKLKMCFLHTFLFVLKF